MAEPASDEHFTYDMGVHATNEPANDTWLAAMEGLVRSGKQHWDIDNIAALIARIREQDATIKRMDDALLLIAHTFTEDSHGNMKTYPAAYYQDIARAARKEPT